MNTNIAEKRNNRKQVTVAKARHLETQSSLFIGQRKSMEKLSTEAANDFQKYTTARMAQGPLGERALIIQAPEAHQLQHQRQAALHQRPRLPLRPAG